MVPTAAHASLDDGAETEYQGVNHDTPCHIWNGGRPVPVAARFGTAPVGGPSGGYECEWAGGATA